MCVLPPIVRKLHNVTLILLMYIDLENLERRLQIKCIIIIIRWVLSMNSSFPTIVQKHVNVFVF